MRVVVVGAGIAGLAAAARLRALAGRAGGLDLVVVDRATEIGGKIRTGAAGGVPVEAGAELFLATEAGGESATVALARRVGLGERLVHPAPVPAAIAVRGGLHPVPAGTLLGVPADPAVVAPLATAGGADEDLGRPIVAPATDTAVGALVRPRYGDEIVDVLVDSMLGGVYAGRADALSLAATMPSLYEAAQREHTLAAAVRSALAAARRPPGSPVFATIDGGLSRLVDAVAAAAGARLELGVTVRALAHTTSGWWLSLGSPNGAGAGSRELAADAVVLAVPATPAARLLAGAGDQGGAVAAVLAELDYASVALVTLVLPAATALPELSGLLVPAGQGFAVKAATFFSRKWPHLGAPVLVRASLGRAGDAGVLVRVDEDLAELAWHELAELLRWAAPAGTLPRPLSWAVHRWGGALPQYPVGYAGRLRAAREALPATLALAGAAFDGIGIAACVRSGEAAAVAVWRGLTAPGTRVALRVGESAP